MSASLWTATGATTHFASLREDLTVDVAIVGGGITGLVCAALLAQNGARVALLEAARLGEGTTGNSTGNLYAPVDWHLYAIADKWDIETMQAVAHSRQDAIDLIEMLVRTHGIDCNFARRPFCLFATDARKQAVEAVEREYRAAVDAHLNARVTRQLPLPLPVEKALIVEGQAQFHPLDFARGLARHTVSDTCRFFENSEVLTIDDERGVLETDGGRVHAQHIVLTTHTPKGVYAVQSEMKVFREYGIAARLRGQDYPQGIYWSVGTKHSIRSADIDGHTYLIVVGEKHPTGHDPESARRVPALERFAAEHFDVVDVPYAWSAQHYRSADELPYIGKTLGSRRTYIATGFASDGLTYGALAGMIISEAIAGRENKWSDLYDASRIAPAKTAKTAIEQTAHTAKNWLSGWLEDRPDTFDAVARGEGRILEIDGERLAVYRDDHGEVTALSALCSHLYCTLSWNAAERSWDCPCHGSRFTVDGDVIEGPALVALRRVYRGPTKDQRHEAERPHRTP